MTFTYRAHKHKQQSLGCHPLIEPSEWVKRHPPSTHLVPGWPHSVRHPAISAGLRLSGGASQSTPVLIGTCVMVITCHWFKERHKTQIR